MADLIEKIIRAIFPGDDNVEILDAYKGTEGHGAMLTGLEEVKVKRTKGGLKRAVVIYGFDSEERIRQHDGGSILDAHGVFYLRLPALLCDIKNVFNEAANTQIPENKAIDEKSFHDYVIQEVRAFKHRCDNLWTSMEMNANRARRALDNSPGTIPSALLEFRISKVEKLADEYTEIGQRAKRLGIKGAEKVKGRMDEVIKVVRQIQDQKTSPHEGVNLAFQCVEKVQAISGILKKAKELEESEQTSSFYR